jgi:hypothetical protein
MFPEVSAKKRIHNNRERAHSAIGNKFFPENSLLFKSQTDRCRILIF